MASFVNQFEAQVRQSIPGVSKDEECFEILTDSDYGINASGGLYISCGEYQDSRLYFNKENSIYCFISGVTNLAVNEEYARNNFSVPVIYNFAFLLISLELKAPMFIFSASKLALFH